MLSVSILSIPFFSLAFTFLFGLDMRLVFQIRAADFLSILKSMTLCVRFSDNRDLFRCENMFLFCDFVS